MSSDIYIYIYIRSVCVYIQICVHISDLCMYIYIYIHTVKTLNRSTMGPNLTGPFKESVDLRNKDTRMGVHLGSK